MKTKPIFITIKSAAKALLDMYMKAFTQPCSATHVIIKTGIETAFLNPLARDIIALPKSLESFFILNTTRVMANSNINEGALKGHNMRLRNPIKGPSKRLIIYDETHMTTRKEDSMKFTTSIAFM